MNLFKRSPFFIYCLCLIFFIYSCGGGNNSSNVEDNYSIIFDTSLNSTSNSVIDLGDSFTINWSIEGNSDGLSCLASGDWSGNKSITVSQETITPNDFGRYRYSLICSNSITSKEKSIIVYVSGLWNNQETVSPVSVGLDATKLEKAFDYAFQDGSYTQAAVLVKNGRFILERYRGISSSEADYVNLNPNIVNASMYENRNEFSVATTWSTAKSFTSILIGIAIDEGHIDSIEDSASDYINEWANDDRSKVTIRNLLDMRSGLVPICGESGKEEPFVCNDSVQNGGQLVWVDNQLDACIERPLAETGVIQPWYDGVPFEEGYWLYSNCDTNVLGEIIFRATGMDIESYAQKKLFSKIGITANWWRDNVPNGQSNGNYLAYCCIDSTSKDFAKFGQMILNKGYWGNEKIVSSEYIDLIRNIVSDSKVSGGRYNGSFSYGLKFWSLFPRIHSDGITYPQPNTLLTTIGFDGQYIVIDFENNVIIVRNSLYQPVLDYSLQRKMKLSLEGVNFPASLPAGISSSGSSSFIIQDFLYKIFNSEID